MARDVKLGILISAKDQASKVFKGTANSADALFRGVRVGTTAASAGMKTFAIAATGVNQALELAKKGAMMFRQTIGQAIAKSIEFRGENDAQVKQLREFQKSISILAARIGDVFLPVVQGIAAAFGPVIKSATQWLELNFKWLASGILENMFKFAAILVDGIAFGATTAAHAFLGLRMVIDGVSVLVNKFFEVSLKGFAHMAFAASEFARTVGEHGLGMAFNDTKNAAWELAKQFKKSGDDGKEAIQGHVAALKETEEMIERVRAGLLVGIGEASVAAMALADKATKSGNLTLEERGRINEENAAKDAAFNAWMLEDLAKDRAARKAADAERAEAEQERIKTAMKRARLIAEIEERNRQQYMATAETAINQAGNIGSAYGKVFHAMMTGQASVGAGYVAMMAIAGQAVLDFAQKAIMAYALEAAAASYKSQAGIPFIGPVLGAAAASVALGVVRAYIGQLPAFAAGGEVRGGSPGRDSVLAMLTPGERVLTVQENREMKRGSRAQNVTNQSVNVTLAPATPMSRAQIDRYIRDTIEPSMRRLQRLGRS